MKKKKWNSPEDKKNQSQDALVIQSFKDRINAVITTMRKWPNFVDLDKECYGLYFQGKEIYIINRGMDNSIDSFPKDVLEKIVLEIEAGRYMADKTFQG